MPTTLSSPTARLRHRALTVLGAVAAPTAVWVVSGPVVGLDLLVRSGTGTGPVGPVAVVVAALGACLAAWALLALLERRTRLARPVWRTVACVVLLLSFAGPLAAGVGPATTAALVAMHAAVAAVLIPLLPGRSLT